MRNPTTPVLRSPITTALKTPKNTAPRTPFGTASSVGTENGISKAPVMQRPVVKYSCEEEAARCIEEEDPNTGRHFYRYKRSLCEFFLWDPEETRKVQLQHKLRKARQEEQLKAEMQNRLNPGGRKISPRSQQPPPASIPSSSGTQHQQLIWMTAAAGREIGWKAGH